MLVAQFDVFGIARWSTEMVSSLLCVVAAWYSHLQSTSAFEELCRVCYLPSVTVAVLLMLSMWLATGAYVAIGADRRRGFGSGVWSLLTGAVLIAFFKVGLPNEYNWMVTGVLCLMLFAPLGYSVLGIVRMMEFSVSRKVVFVVAAVIWNLSMAASGAVICQMAWDCPAVLVIVIPFLAGICCTCGGDFSYFLVSSKIWMTVRMVCSLVWIAYVSSVVINMRAGDTSTHSMFDFLFATGIVGLLQSTFLWAVWGASVNEAANTEHYVAWYDRFGNLIRRDRAPGEDMMGCLMSIVVGFLVIAFLSAFFAPIVFIVNCVQFADVWTRGTRAHILSVVVAVVVSGIVLCEVPKVWRYVRDRTDEVSKQIEARKNANIQTQIPLPVQYNSLNLRGQGRGWR